MNFYMMKVLKNLNSIHGIKLLRCYIFVLVEGNQIKEKITWERLRVEGVVA